MRKLLCILSVVVLCASCNKNNSTTSPTISTITSIDPTIGSANTVVIIKGSNFKTTIAADTVKFNGAVAIVQSATDNTLTVLSPTNGATGAVTVTTNNGTATGPVFTYSINSGDVFIVGSVVDSSLQTVGVNTVWKINSIATYWKNGIPIKIGDSTKVSSATSIAVSGNDIYVGGSEGNNSVFWKNGVPVRVNDGIYSASNPCVATSGSDFYMASTNNLESGLYSVDSYWKNGVGVNLPRLRPENSPSRTTAITVVNNDVYVAGYEANTFPSVYSGANIVKYWKNGVAIALTDGAKNATTTSIAVFNNDLYVSGQEASEHNNINATSVAKYWKNGMPVVLTDGIYNGLANGVAVSGNDVYVIGTEGIGTHYDTKFWKNGVPTILAKGQAVLDTNAKSIIISGKDVYIVGFDHGNAVYWKNGIEVKLPGTSKNTVWSYAYGIIIK